MSNYVLGIGGNCCDSCAPDDACKAKPVVTSASSASGTAGSSFSYTITGTNTPTSYAATGLPAGLSVNTGTGVISGTTPSCGTYSGITISAINACGTGSKSLTITTTGPVPAFSSLSLYSGSATVVGTSITVTEGNNISVGVNFTNSPTSSTCGTPPPGMSCGSLLIYGTPTTPGIYSLYLSASNSCGTGAVTITITVNSAVCDMPTLLCDSIQSSMTKCGFDENPGHASTPPKIYLKRTFSGSLTNRTYDNGTSCTGTFVEVTSTYSGYCEQDGVDCVTPINNSLTVDGVAWGCGDAFPTGCSAVECVPVITATTATYTGDNTCRTATEFYGTASDTLSIEYATSDLIVNTLNALPSYPNTWDGTCSSYRDLDTDEMTYTVRRFKYKFELPTLTGCTSYQISWMEGSTARSYTWNGTDTETGIYTVNEPSSNGTIAITDVQVTCICP